MHLSNNDFTKYKRQISIPEIGVNGQLKLLQAKVLVVGLGGLGSPVCLYLAACGIGEIGILDSDKVELSNLQRQILHSSLDLENFKVASAKEKIIALNPEINVKIFHVRLNDKNFSEIFTNYDVIIDASDNYETKFLVAYGCDLLLKPYIHAGISGWEGQIMTVFPRQTACYRCVFPEQPETNDSSVIGAVAGVIGSLQALQAIKIILELENKNITSLLSFNGLTQNFRKIQLQKQVNCILCGKK